LLATLPTAMCAPISGSPTPRGSTQVVTQLRVVCPHCEATFPRVQVILGANDRLPTRHQARHRLERLQFSHALEGLRETVLPTFWELTLSQLPNPQCPLSVIAALLVGTTRHEETHRGQTSNSDSAHVRSLLRCLVRVWWALTHQLPVSPRPPRCSHSGTQADSVTGDLSWN